MFRFPNILMVFDFLTERCESGIDSKEIQTTDLSRVTVHKKGGGFIYLESNVDRVMIQSGVTGKGISWEVEGEGRDIHILCY